MNSDKNLIILVDDNLGDIVLIERAVKASLLPIEFISFLSGRAFITHIFSLATLPKMIILDINMPVLDGFEILDILGKDPALRKITKIVMSSSSNPKDIYKSYQHGAHCYINKPLAFFDLKIMMQIIILHWLKPYPFNYKRIDHVHYNLSH